MYYREITIKEYNSEEIETELMFLTAVARVDGIELIRLNILCSEEERNATSSKNPSVKISKLLKTMKQKGSIQFFASAHSFATSSTEAVFLMNKYPDVFSEEIGKTSGEEFYYIKL